MTAAVRNARALPVVFPFLLSFPVILSPGCGSRGATKPTQDELCPRLVDRSIRCLELEVQAGQTTDFSAKERLEKTRIHRRDAVAACQAALSRDHILARDLALCLKGNSCLTYRRCRNAASLRARARKALAALSGRSSTGDDSSPEDPSSACRDRYLLGSLKAQGDTESDKLLQELRAACKRRNQRRVSDLTQRLDQALAPSNPHPVSDLSSICREAATQSPEPTAADPGPTRKSSSPGQRAIRELCREQWRLRSALANTRKLLGFLTPPGCAECALRVCRFLGLTKALERSSLRSVQAVGRRFRRLCRVDAPVFWISQRLGAKRRPGPITCRRARHLLNRAASHAPDDPTVQVASCLLEQRCPQKHR